MLGCAVNAGVESHEKSNIFEVYQRFAAVRAFYHNWRPVAFVSTLVDLPRPVHLMATFDAPDDFRRLAPLYGWLVRRFPRATDAVVDVRRFIALHGWRTRRHQALVSTTDAFDNIHRLVATDDAFDNIRRLAYVVCWHLTPARHGAEEPRGEEAAPFLPTPDFSTSGGEG